MLPRTSYSAHPCPHTLRVAGPAVTAAEGKNPWPSGRDAQAGGRGTLIYNHISKRETATVANTAKEEISPNQRDQGGLPGGTVASGGIWKMNGGELHHEGTGELPGQKEKHLNGRDLVRTSAVGAVGSSWRSAQQTAPALWMEGGLGPGTVVYFTRS